MSVFTYSKVVQNWLFIGLVMLFIQIIVGGITRLTESGLSITKWEVVEGTIPPLTEASWEEEFELYKATPQYKEINEGMTLSDFKFIYFWEYIHRFWARFMGFVFIIPFFYFFIKKQFDSYILKRLAGVIGLAILAATFGWIMVASGLIERPWVNAYKLSFHLCIALSVFVYLLWTWFEVKYEDKLKIERYKLLIPFIVIIWIQLFLGGMMSGMKAAVYYPEWPTMNGNFIPSVILDVSQWNMHNFNYYDQSSFLPTLTQFIHRMTAYVIFALGVIIWLYYSKLARTRKVAHFVMLFLCIQVALGICTLLYSKGEVPILLGVLHQGVAVIFLSFVYYLLFLTKGSKEIN